MLLFRSDCVQQLIIHRSLTLSLNRQIRRKVRIYFRLPGYLIDTSWTDCRPLLSNNTPQRWNTADLTGLELGRPDLLPRLAQPIAPVASWRYKCVGVTTELGNSSHTSHNSMYSSRLQMSLERRRLEILACCSGVAYMHVGQPV
jgi:hypothetical protein